MGRLFWKFFLTFWLALLVAGIGVGTAVWLRHNAWQGSETAKQGLMSGVRHRLSLSRKMLSGTAELSGCATFLRRCAMLLSRRFMRLTIKTGNFYSVASRPRFCSRRVHYSCRPPILRRFVGYRQRMDIVICCLCRCRNTVLPIIRRLLMVIFRVLPGRRVCRHRRCCRYFCQSDIQCGAGLVFCQADSQFAQRFYRASPRRSGYPSRFIDGKASR